MQRSIQRDHAPAVPHAIFVVSFDPQDRHQVVLFASRLASVPAVSYRFVDGSLAGRDVTLRQKAFRYQ